MRATWPTPSPEEFALFYPPDYVPHVRNTDETPAGSALSIDDGNRVLNLLLTWAQTIAETRTYLIPPLPADARVLEVGCGTGEFLRRLVRRGWNCVGIEPAAQAARCAAQSCQAEIICDTLESADLPAASFDGAFAFHVLEHIAQPRQALDRIASFLKPTGFLVLSVPNAGSWQMTAFKSCWSACEVPRHLWHFEPAQIVRLVTSTGFTIERVLAQRHSVVDLVASLGLVLRARDRAPRLAQSLIATHDSAALLLRLLTLPLEWAHEVTDHATGILIVARKAA